MNRLNPIVNKYAVCFGIVTGLTIIAAIIWIIVMIPEEAGLVMTILAFLAISISMLLILQDLFHAARRSRRKML